MARDVPHKPVLPDGGDGPHLKLPANPAVLEIRILARDATGNTGVAGRQALGIHTFQVYD